MRYSVALSNSTKVVRRPVHARVHGRAAGLDAFAPNDGAHLRAGVVFADLDLIVLRRTREALLGPAEPLHDLGHILGAARCARARLQLGQHGLEAGGLGVIDGAIFLFARR